MMNLKTRGWSRIVVPHRRKLQEDDDFFFEGNINRAFAPAELCLPVTESAESISGSDSVADTVSGCALGGSAAAASSSIWDAQTRKNVNSKSSQSQSKSKSNKRITCSRLGCFARFAAASVTAYDTHMNVCHSHQCSMCGRGFVTARSLDLHITEVHDSYFSAMEERAKSKMGAAVSVRVSVSAGPQAEKEPEAEARFTAIFACFVEGCPVKCASREDRVQHLRVVHLYPEGYVHDVWGWGRDRAAAAADMVIDTKSSASSLSMLASMTKSLPVSATMMSAPPVPLTTSTSASTSVRECSECGTWQAKGGFSATQWRKLQGDSTRRCVACIARRGSGDEGPRLEDAYQAGGGGSMSMISVGSTRKERRALQFGGLNRHSDGNGGDGASDTETMDV